MSEYLYHYEIFRSNYYCQRKCACKGLRQGSKVRMTEAKTNFVPFGGFQTVTPVWMHTWLQNDAQSLQEHIRGALLFFKVICQISRSQRKKNHWLSTKLGISGLECLLEFRDCYEIMHKARSSIEEMLYCFSRSSVKVVWDKKLSIFTFIKHFQNITPVWIYWWLWNDTKNLN